MSNLLDSEEQVMTCDEVEALLPLVVDGVIDEKTDPELFRHLGQCHDCQQSLAAYDLVDLALSGGQHKPAAKKADVVHYHIPWPIAAAAAVVLSTGLGFWVINGSTAPAPAPTVQQRGPEILQVLPAGPDRSQTLYVIRENGGIHVIDQQQLDGGVIGQENGDATPVLQPKALPVSASVD